MHSFKSVQKWHILYSFNTLCNGESWVCLAVKHSHQQLMHLDHVWLPVSRINHQKRINKMCGGRQGYKIFCFVLFWSLLGPKYSFLVKYLIGSRVAFLMGRLSKHQLSESSFSGPCCCRAPDADDDWLGRGGRGCHQDLTRLIQALRAKDPLADSPGGQFQFLETQSVRCNTKHYTGSLLLKNATRGPGTENHEAFVRLLFDFKKQTLSALVCNAPVQQKWHLTHDSFWGCPLTMSFFSKWVL